MSIAQPSLSSRQKPSRLLTNGLTRYLNLAHRINLNPLSRLMLDLRLQLYNSITNTSINLNLSLPALPQSTELLPTRNPMLTHGLNYLRRRRNLNNRNNLNLDLRLKNCDTITNTLINLN